MPTVKPRAKTSYPSKLLILMAGLLGISVTLLFLHQSRTLQPVPISKPLSWAAVVDALQGSADIEQALEQELSRGDLLSADWRFNTLLKPLWSQAATLYPDHEWQEGTVQDYFSTLQSRYTQSLYSGFSNTLHRMARGDISPVDLQNWLKEKDDPVLYDQLDQAEEWIIITRQEQAAHWYRIMFQNPAPDWVSDAKVREILSTAPPPTGTQKIVWGPALSPKEQDQTAGTLLITGMVQTATFKTETPDAFGYSEWEPAPLPLGISLYPVEMNAQFTSEWTSLKPIFIWRPPPPSVSRSLEEEIHMQYKSALRRDLWSALHQWKKQVSSQPTP